MNDQPAPTLDEARRLLEQGDAAGAIRVLQQLLRMTPDLFLGRLKLAEAYHLKAQAKDPVARTMAVREFERALRLVPPDEQSHMLLVGLAAQLGQANLLRREYAGRFQDLPFARECLTSLRAQEPSPARSFVPRGSPVLIVLLIASVAIGLWAVKRSRPVLSGSTPARSFILRDLAGNDVALSDFRGEKVVVLDFWATWCPPCRASMPALARFRERYAARGVEVLSVNLEESPERVREYISAQGLSLRVALDLDGNVARAYGVRGIPTVLVIDKQGKERARFVGYLADLESQLEKAIRSLL